MTVAAVALPLAIAFGVGCGADAAAGLITAIIGGIIIGLLSGHPLQISGPTGAMTAVLIPVIAARQISGMFVVCLMAGIILLICGVFRLGRLISFIPMPVITGFTSGIAVVIAIGQLGNAVGAITPGESNLIKLKEFGEAIISGNLSLWAVGITLLTILLIRFWPKKFAERVPGSLAAVIIFTALQLIFSFPVKIVGVIPKTLLPNVRLGFADIKLGDMPSLLTTAVSLAALGMIESLLCGVAAARMSRSGENGAQFNFDADRELIAQGIGNIIIPFFGGVPATAAIARTSVGIRSGGKTRLVGLSHAIVLLISMLLLAPVMSSIPMPCLAGVLFMTAWRMNEFYEIRRFFGHGVFSAVAKFLVTLAVTVVFNLVVAIAVGVGLSMLLFVVKSARLSVTVAELDHGRLGRGENPPVGDVGDVRVVYLSGPLFFGSIDKLRDETAALCCDLIIFSLRGVNMTDTSGIVGLEQLYEDLTRRGIKIILCAVQPAVESELIKSGFCDRLEYPLYWSADLALREYGTIKNLQ